MINQLHDIQSVVNKQQDDDLQNQRLRNSNMPLFIVPLALLTALMV